MRCVRMGAVQPVSRAAASEPRRELGLLFGKLEAGECLWSVCDGIRGCGELLYGGAELRRARVIGTCRGM